MEAWIENTLKGVRILAGRDDDFARVQNGVGFNGTDSGFGHFLAGQASLGPRLGHMARKMCWKYKGQLGADLVKSMWPEGMPTSRAEVKQTAQPVPAPAPEQPERPTRTVGLSPTSDGLVVRFPYDPELVTWIKTFPQGRFDAPTKTWSLPLRMDWLITIINKGFVPGPQLMMWMHEQTLKPAPASEMPVTPPPVLPPPVKKERTDFSELRDRMLKLGAHPFQADGVVQIEKWDGRALLADEMGLGKTIQTLLYLREHPQYRPALVICPASLKLNWLREAHTWCPDSRAQVLSSSPVPGQQLKKDFIYIINYDIVGKWIKQLELLRPAAMALDEAHYIKNSKALRTKAVMELGKTVPHVIAITGTPVINGRPMECFNALSMIRPTLFPSRWKFGMRYCDPKFNAWSGGTDFSGATNIPELHSILQDAVMIRRLKRDVLKDLPAKVRSVVPLELNSKSRKEYNEVYQGVIRTLSGETKPKAMTALSQIEYLKQAAFRGKMEQVIEWVENFLESDGKLILFGNHIEALDVIQAKFANVCVRVDGSVSLPERDARVTRFTRDPECRLFLGNIKAAGVGLNLQVASNVAFMEFPWTPGELTQAEDRVHRIGQTESCNIYLLAAADTIDVAICETLARKARINDQLMDGIRPTEQGILDEILTVLGVSIEKGE